MKDCDGKTIHVGNIIEIVNVPEIAKRYVQDIIGRKYTVVRDGNGIKLVNKKYKELYRDEISAQWYLGKNCKIV